MPEFVVKTYARAAHPGRPAWRAGEAERAADQASESADDRPAPGAFAAMPEADERITEHAYTRKVSGGDACAAIAGAAQAEHDRLIALCTEGDEPE